MVPTMESDRHFGFNLGLSYLVFGVILVSQQHPGTLAGMLGESIIMAREIGDCDDGGTGEMVMIGNRIRKVNRSTHLYTGNVILYTELNDDYKASAARVIEEC
ncbi:hypothetical protein AAG570_003049 [Ranatra chinensis]|uniref:Uncharacterized protein n=1 Tax=Ranatra chinensis TaxID=642074 RepID=A0ABD0YJY4_9HEMI